MNKKLSIGEIVFIFDVDEYDDIKGVISECVEYHENEPSLYKVVSVDNKTYMIYYPQKTNSLRMSTRSERLEELRKLKEENESKIKELRSCNNKIDIKVNNIKSLCNTNGHVFTDWGVASWTEYVGRAVPDAYSYGRIPVNRNGWFRRCLCCSYTETTINNPYEERNNKTK